jgi:PKD repeat protein
MDGNIVSYEWNFGDDSPPVFGATPDHTYSNGDVYSVTLKVTDNDGVSDSEGAVAVIGNRPPSAVSLVSPDDGAMGLERTVTFVWKKGTDPDGDDLTYHLNVCEDPNFIGCAFTVVARTESLVRYAGVGGLLGGLALLGAALGTGLGPNRKQRPTRRFMTLVFVGMLIAGFVPGCGDDPPPAPPANTNISETVAGLDAATTYYWKVRADDGSDTTDSETWSFTTQ